jgi:hypothetical protein
MRDESRAVDWSGALAERLAVMKPVPIGKLCQKSPFGGDKRPNRPCVCLDGMLSDAACNGGLTLSTRFVLPTLVRRRRWGAE